MVKNTPGNVHIRSTFTARVREFFKSLFRYYIMNTFVANFPSRRFRLFYYRLWGMKVGVNTSINRKFAVTNPNNVEIGNNTRIGWSCHFQGLGGIKIGNNVNFASYSKIWTGSHDMNSPDFISIYEPVIIGDYVWVSTGVNILQGVKIGEGAVIMAGAVVVKDVEPYSIVGGVPAEKKGERSKDIKYDLPSAPRFY